MTYSLLNPPDRPPGNPLASYFLCMKREGVRDGKGGEEGDRERERGADR